MADWTVAMLSWLLPTITHPLSELYDILGPLAPVVTHPILCEKERRRDRKTEREREREREREGPVVMRLVTDPVYWWTVVILPWRSAGSSRVETGGQSIDQEAAHWEHQRAAGRQIMVVGDNTPPWTGDSDSLCLPSPQPAMWPTREMWYHQ